MPKERLQKILAAAGVASRRAAEEMILAGKIKVNGSTITELGFKADAQSDKIEADGKMLKPEHKVYILLHKPKGVITTCADESGRETVMDYLGGIRERVFPVGRLDYNTEGVLLLTNDGLLANRLAHPKYKIDKTYIAKLDGVPGDDELAMLRDGIELDGKKTLPAKVQVLHSDLPRNNSEIEITISEGRNRQVRRMFESIGCRVRSLVRTRFGFFDLQGIRRGQNRRLKEAEIRKLLEHAGLDYEKPAHLSQPRTKNKPADKRNNGKASSKNRAGTTSVTQPFGKFIKRKTDR